MPRVDALIVIVNRNGEGFFRLVLSDDVLIQYVADFLRFGDIPQPDFYVVAELLLNDLVAEFNALVTDIYAGAGNELAHLLLRLAAERAFELPLVFLAKFHRVTPPQPLSLLSLDAAGGRTTTSSISP